MYKKDKLLIANAMRKVARVFITVGSVIHGVAMHVDPRDSEMLMRQMMKEQRKSIDRAERRR